MNIDQIKKIKLQEFLATIDCKPVKTVWCEPHVPITT